MFDLRANLNGLLDSNERLYVADVIHKTTIEINEDHTEDSGVTGKTFLVDSIRMIIIFFFLIPMIFIF